MPIFSNVSKEIVLFVLIIVFMSTIDLFQAASVDNVLQTDLSDSNEAQIQRRVYDLNQLRRFLLTSNAEQRAAKRERENILKRKLIHEYLESINDPDPDKAEEVKKRFCASWEEFQANRAVCFG